jgi:hypothetical protein
MESFVIWHSYLWALFVAAMLAPNRLHTRQSSTTTTTAAVAVAVPIDRSASEVLGREGV